MSVSARQVFEPFPSKTLPALAMSQEDLSPVASSDTSLASDSETEDVTVANTTPAPAPTPAPLRLPLRRIDTSVRLQDTASEGRPSIYLFIFVNPLSGDQKGADLIHLPIQHFRLRRLPQVQVEIHNILDRADREAGFQRVTLIENMVKLNQLPPIEQTITTPGGNRLGTLAPDVSTRHIHVWSAGGDGTVMSVFELLAEHHIDLDLVFFSCIPFGTGNDFSQVLGWGRTIPHKDILGQRLRHLEDLVTQRLERSAAARLDIWQVEMTAHQSGYVRLAGPDRQDGHDVAEVKQPQSEEDGHHRLVRKMCNYMSIGVQGYVGSGFEKHRAGNRFANMLVYTIESAKWVFLRKFPPVTHFIDRITSKDESLLVSPDPHAKRNRRRSSPPSTTTDGQALPEMTTHPIDFVIQNIPHIWGREVDLWGEARSGLEAVRNRSGPTDHRQWNPQRANDGSVEIMVINNLYSYFKKLANIRHHVSRIGQFDTPFEIQFRPPAAEPPKRRLSSFFQNRYERENIICIMCDGEFYILKDPKALKFERFAQIWTLGRSDEKVTGRLVADEQASTRAF